MNHRLFRLYTMKAKHLQNSRLEQLPFVSSASQKTSKEEKGRAVEASGSEAGSFGGCAVSRRHTAPAVLSPSSLYVMPTLEKDVLNCPNHRIISRHLSACCTPALGWDCPEHLSSFIPPAFCPQYVSPLHPIPSQASTRYKWHDKRKTENKYIFHSTSNFAQCRRWFPYTSATLRTTHGNSVLSSSRNHPNLLPKHKASYCSSWFPRVASVLQSFTSGCS